jgi:hypothetical protein
LSFFKVGIADALLVRMTYKHTMTIHKAWTPVNAAGFSLNGIFARLRNALKIEIPVGYQDESGFHYEIKAAAKDNKSSLPL